MSHRPIWFLGAWALVALEAAPAQGHALLLTPQARDMQDGYKDPPRAPPGTGAPCGIGRMIPPQPQTTYQPGQALHVEWRETVSHPGCFVVDFAAADDANFQILGVKSHSSASGGLPRAWSLDVTLPSAPCTACTLRLRQIMLTADVPDSGCPPNPIPAVSTYYSCANVTLGDAPATGAGGASGGVGGAPGAGGSSGSGQGGSAGTTDSGSGGCALAGSSGRAGAIALLLAVLAIRRRRR